MMALGVLYIISPIDLIPDFLALVGVADDFGLFLWLAGSLLGESGRYVQWEQQAQAPYPGAPRMETPYPGSAYPGSSGPGTPYPGARD